MPSTILAMKLQLGATGIHPFLAHTPWIASGGGLGGEDECAVVNRVVSIGLAEKVTFKPRCDRGKGLGNILGRKRLRNLPWVIHLIKWQGWDGHRAGS